MSIYYNPTAASSLISQPFPFFKTVTDGAKLVHAMGNYIVGEDEIDRGIYDGQSKLKRAAMKFLPPFNRVTSIEAMAKQEFSNNK